MSQKRCKRCPTADRTQRTRVTQSSSPDQNASQREPQSEQTYLLTVPASHIQPVAHIGTFPLAMLNGEIEIESPAGILSTMPPLPLAPGKTTSIICSDHKMKTTKVMPEMADCLYHG